MSCFELFFLLISQTGCYMLISRVLYSHGRISVDLDARTCVLCRVQTHMHLLQVELVLAALKIGAAPGVLFPRTVRTVRQCTAVPRCTTVQSITHQRSAAHHRAPEPVALGCLPHGQEGWSAWGLLSCHQSTYSWRCAHQGTPLLQPAPGQPHLP